MRAGAAFLVIGIVSSSIGCEKESQAPIQDKIPAITQTLTPESPQIQWENLSPLDRLVNLKKKNLNIEGLNKEVENTRAVVEFFCQNVMCHFTSEDILNNRIERFDEENLLIKLQSRGEDFTPRQLNVWQKLPAFTTPGKIIFINDKAIENEAKRVMDSNPNLRQQRKEEDFRILLDQAIKIHEVGHLNMTHEEILFQPILAGETKYDKLEGFVFKGHDIQGKSKYILGLEEAKTEVLAQIIRVRSDLYLWNSEFREGAELLYFLVTASGITDDEFIEYTDGRRSITEFIERIGSLKEEELYDNRTIGTRVLFDIALVTQRAKTLEEVKSYLNSVLKVQIK